MGDFLAFVVRRWVVALVVVIGVLLTSVGYVQQGLEFWQWGPPGWVFQLIGFLLFAGVVTYLIYEWDQKVQTLPEPASGPPPEDVEERKRLDAHTGALIQIDRAIEDADWEDITPDPPEIDRCLAVLRSAFATVRKQYGLPTPNLSQPTKASLDYGVIYLRRILPYLRAGHVEEARAAASELVD